MKPRRFVRMFKPRFAALVREGKKFQTIRPMPKRMPQPGDIIDCRMWEGVPYKSNQRKIGDHRITEVHCIDIFETTIHVDGVLLFPTETQDLATADGFVLFEEMIGFFIKEHGLPLNGKPFNGILIKWKT